MQNRRVSVLHSEENVGKFFMSKVFLIKADMESVLNLFPPLAKTILNGTLGHNFFS